MFEREAKVEKESGREQVIGELFTNLLHSRMIYV